MIIAITLVTKVCLSGRCRKKRIQVNAAEEEMQELCAYHNAEYRNEKECINAISHLGFLNLSFHFAKIFFVQMWNDELH